VAVLRWSDLDFADPYPSVRFWRAVSIDVEGPTKTNRCRTVPLAPDLVDALLAYRHSGERVFDAASGRPIKADYLCWSLRKLCQEAQAPRVSWKDLRHTFATDLTRRGVPLNVVQRLLGHTTIQMTTRYAHTPDASLAEAVALLAHAPAHLPGTAVTLHTPSISPDGMEPQWPPVAVPANSVATLAA
jgi:integrase